MESSTLAAFAEHFARHRAESGRDGAALFMPFEQGGQEQAKGLDAQALQRGVSELAWQRCWVAIVDSGTIVGHVDLKGDGLRSGLHRCELGIGLESAYRAHGMGRQLMLRAIEFARLEAQIEWIDLRVFAHNTIARRLYRSLGFTEVGTLTDRFRIDGASIDDVIMSLPVG